MAAKDYFICPGFSNLYISKLSKKHPNTMTDDRKVIEENDILGIIEWYIRYWCVKNKKVSEICVTADNNPLFSLTPKGKLLEELQQTIKEQESDDKG